MTRKPHEGQSNYFIAIIPPSPVYEEAQQLKLYFRDRYHSRASLNSPPHITLHMPFWWKDKKEKELIDHLRQFANTNQPVHIHVRNFASFSSKVIFMQVEKSDRLEDLQRNLHRFCKRELNLFNADYKDRPFHPHLTLAFRDLRKTMFLEAWEEFALKEYTTDFLIDKITLLKHNGKVWQVLEDCPLNGN